MSSLALGRDRVFSNFDIQCGDLQATSTYGGAAVQITNSTNNAITTAQTNHYTKQETDIKIDNV